MLDILYQLQWKKLLNVIPIFLVWFVVVRGYQCSHCDKYYASKKLLTDHISHHHVNKYQCSFCDMTCPSTSGLTTHIRYKHLDFKPFKCHTCDYAWVHTDHNPADISVQSHRVRFQFAQIQGNVCAALLMLGHGHLRSVCTDPDNRKLYGILIDWNVTSWMWTLFQSQDTIWPEQPLSYTLLWCISPLYGGRVWFLIS
jgi:hypothetical protein